MQQPASFRQLPNNRECLAAIGDLAHFRDEPDFVTDGEFMSSHSGAPAGSPDKWRQWEAGVTGALGLWLEPMRELSDHHREHCQAEGDLMPEDVHADQRS